jgi:hypothetical protein
MMAAVSTIAREGQPPKFDCGSHSLMMVISSVINALVPRFSSLIGVFQCA